MNTFTTLLCLGLTLAAPSAAAQDNSYLSSFRNVEGRLIPSDQADRIDPVLQVRQVVPSSVLPITLTPVCDEFNNYFYVTPQNYTWQLQCTTNYEGTIIQNIETTGFADCIVSCADYNRANGAGLCIAITFNGPDDSSLGLCTQFSTVANSLLAYEEGNVQESALLVYSPDGTVFATPRPAAGFSGQPSQAPTVDPLPSATISDSTTVFFTTSMITFTSCPPGVSCSPNPTTQPSSTATSRSGLPAAPSTGPSNSGLPPASSTTPLASSATISATSSATISITDGGVRPGTTSSSAGPATTALSNSIGGQVTFTEVVTYTVYEVQAVALCPPTPGPCTQTTSTSTRTGLRTQLSCSPGACSGVGAVTNAVADVAAATCIEAA